MKTPRKRPGMRIGLAVIIFGACVGAALVGEFALAVPPAQFEGGIDLSRSVARDCGGLAGETRRAIAQGGAQEGSSLALLGLGSSALNPEPVRLFEQAIPVLSDAPFGKDEAGFAARNKAVFEGFQRACEAAPESKDTPLLGLVARGIADLRSRGCAVKGLCYFVIQSDLEDDTDPRLRAAIARATKGPSASLPADLAGSIENAGIRMMFVGTSEVRARRSRKHAAPEALAALWKSLFTHPELVSFQPYCGQ
jgi:hypothetical protein